MAGQADRHARALAILRAAELQTGVSRRPSRIPNVGAEAPDETTPPEPDTTQPAPAPAPAKGRHSLIEPLAGHSYPLDQPVAHLAPGGALAPGSVVAVVGSTRLLLAMLAAASQAGQWFAFVGGAETSFVASAQAGLNLARVAVLPDPAGEATGVIATLLEGLAVVVGAEVQLADSQRRRLAARARERGTLLVSAANWPGANLTLTVTAKKWTGIAHSEGSGRGEGWISGYELDVRRTGRGAAAAPQTFQVTL